MSSGSRVVPYRRTDMTKLIVAFRNFANAPKKSAEFDFCDVACSKIASLAADRVLLTPVLKTVIRNVIICPIRHHLKIA